MSQRRVLIREIIICPSCGARATATTYSCGCVSVFTTGTEKGGHNAACTSHVNFFIKKKVCQEHSRTVRALA